MSSSNRPAADLDLICKLHETLGPDGCGHPVKLLLRRGENGRLRVTLQVEAGSYVSSLDGRQLDRADALDVLTWLTEWADSGEAREP